MIKQIDTKNISFRKQPFFRYCGHCQIAAILEYYGIANKHFKKCSLTHISKFTGLTLPYSFRFLRSKYCLDTKGGRLKKMTNRERIEFIKNRVNEEKPTIILLAHGWKHKKNSIKQGNLFRMLTMQHWISIRGYDDINEEFLIYDSSIKQNADGIINLRLKYKDFLLYWKWGVLGFMSYQFVWID